MLIAQFYTRFVDLREIGEGMKVWKCGLVASSSGQGPVAGSYEHGNEPSGSLKGGISWLAEWILAP
jgi:hypothetical protein